MSKKLLSVITVIALVVSVFVLPSAFAAEKETAKTHFETTKNGVTLSVDLDKASYTVGK